jgi:tRNA pseudouridine38-40 synthase
LPVWKLTVEYEGTRYRGWQEQRGSRTVAGEIRTAAEKFIGSRVDLTGAGRTDAGVHALHQIARLSGSRRAKPEEVRRAINSELPPDINLLDVESVDPQFDPRRDAIRRYYLYQISTRRSAFAKRFVWWVRDPLDVELMTNAAKRFAGRHDFANFCERREDQRSTMVVVESVEVGRDGDLILFRIGASHFLWKMVRRLVGAFVEVGLGKLEVGDIDRMLDLQAAKKPGAARSSGEESPFDVAAHTAPPSGLFLERVVYSKTEPAGPLRPAVPVRK